MKNKAQKILLAIILLLAAWQAFQFIQFASSEIPSVWTWIGKPAQWRSAAYTTSETFADYIAFANEIIPVDAAVASLETDSSSWQFSHKSYLQYFFMPRQLTICGNRDCINEIISNGGYALIGESQAFLNDTQEAGFQDQLIEFNSKWAVLTPSIPSDLPPSPLEGYSSIKHMAIDLMLPGVWILFVALPGMALFTVLLPEWRLMSHFFLGTTLGLGMVSFLLYIFLLFIQTLSVVLILIVTALWMLTAGIFSFWSAKKMNRHPVKTIFAGKLTAADLVILAVGLTAAFISIAKSYWGTDGIILWADKGYGISFFGLTEGSSYWGTWAAQYPLQNPILISIFKTLFGDSIPQSKLVPAIFYTGLIYAAAEYFRANTASKAYNYFLLIWALTPFVLEHGTLGYANLSFTFFLLTANILSLTAANKENKQLLKNQLYALSGIFFALASWTRPEGSILSLLSLAILGIQRKDFRSNWPQYLPLGFFLIIWETTKSQVYLYPSETGNLINGIGNILKGNINWGDAGYLAKSFFQTFLSLPSWGFLFWLLLSGLFVLVIRKRAASHTISLITIGVLSILAALAIVYMKTYNPAACDVSCMVNTAMERLALPGIALLWLGISEYLLSLLKPLKETGS